MKRTLALLVAVLSGSAFNVACADEGMWLLTRPPVEQLKRQFQFEASPEWLTHMQRSCVRFETGGSGSLVSPNGLVMTNHHVGSDMIAKLSTTEKDLMSKGFLAATQRDELKCPDLEVRVLWAIKDVTEQIKAESSTTENAADAGLATRKAIDAIESEAQAATGLKSEVVKLYQGALYHLYQYKSYTDVRLVFAPEVSAAFFGGDTDNFEFPRYNLDCCFFRIYENDKPLESEHHLRWAAEGAKENDLIFVFGHPGSTRRAVTTSHLGFLRDVDHPTRLSFLWRAESKLAAFSGRSSENARIAREDGFGIANSRKAFEGQLAGLQDPRTFGKKIDEEQRLLSAAAQTPSGAEGLQNALNQVTQAQLAHKEIYQKRFVIDRLARSSELLQAGLHIVRLAKELPLPSGDRLTEYSDAGLDSLYHDLYSTEPVYDALEVHRLTAAISHLVEVLGANDPIVGRVLGGRSPADAAQFAVQGCTFKEPSARRALVEGGQAAVTSSKDPMLDLAAAMDGASRRLRKVYEDRVEAVEQQAYATIAQAKFDSLGESVYPDATFTLRMTYGTVTGFEDAGVKVPAFTTLGGTFKRHQERKGQMGFDLPESWIKHERDIDPNVPFNFICTADIIGGNSGSPVVNAKGEVVGLVFDGNIHSLPGSFIYDIEKNRAVAVDVRGMMEAFSKVYKADALIKELKSAKPRSPK